MGTPLFFSSHIPPAGEQLTLEEEDSRHIVQVLRIREGNTLSLTDGMGNAALAILDEAHKKRCTVSIRSLEHRPRLRPQLTIAIGMIKNASRFEWFLEKATELGTAAIIPMITDRTEKQHARLERLQSICRSAMLQSGQWWLPQLSEPTRLDDVIREAPQQQKFIAHCDDVNKTPLTSAFNPSVDSHIVLIGPEGDFTPAEINRATSQAFTPVSLGPTRLRTETAGVYAAVVCRGELYL